MDIGTPSRRGPLPETGMVKPDPSRGEVIARCTWPARNYICVMSRYMRSSRGRPKSAPAGFIQSCRPTVVGAAIVAFSLIGHVDRSVAQAKKTENNLSLSAATKKAASKRQARPTGQIACTVAGCHPIPPNCHPETGYNWDGIPTGFDIVVCGPPRGRSGF